MSSVEAKIQKLHTSRQTIVKAFVAGEEIDTTRAHEVEEGDVFTIAGAIEPPYDPESLTLLVEHSNSLRPNLDAYSTNIDGFGYRLEPAIDFDAEDLKEKVADAIYLERLWRSGDEEDDESLEPTDEEVEQKLEELKRLSRREKARATRFFNYAYAKGSFIRLRRQTRQELETTGNAYWEVLRTKKGKLSRFLDVAGQTVRILPLELGFTEIEEKILISPVAFGEINTKRRFRQFLQSIDGKEQVFFKEYGDPRIVSNKTGRVYEDIGQLKKEEKGARPATELVHFNVFSPRTAYGVPRWIGALLAVLGSRKMEEVNFIYFENKAVPPLAIIVSGGKLGEDSIPRIESYIETHIKGSENFHKILILEAEVEDKKNVGPTGQAKIELVPLTQAWMNDELFTTYDQRNMDKTGQAFRLPRLLRGETRDFNRSTALSALSFAEEQVFQPERDEFDHWINRWIMPELDIRFWRFRSNAPITRDPERMGDLTAKLTRAGALLTNDARELAEDIFNKDFPPIKADWAKQPLALTMSGYLPEGSPRQEEEEGKADLSAAGLKLPEQDDRFMDPEEEARRRRALEEGAGILQAKHVADAQRQETEERMERKVIKVPLDVFETFLAPEEEDE